MKIFLTARLGPFLFIDIFHILGLSSATCKHMCEPLWHLQREISGERTSWGFSGFSRGYCSVTQSCLTLCDPMDAAHQASLSLTIAQSLLKLKSIESVMPSNHLILCCPFSSCLWSFPTLGSFPVSRLPGRSGSFPVSQLPGRSGSFPASWLPGRSGSFPASRLPGR